MLLQHGYIPHDRRSINDHVHRTVRRIREVHAILELQQLTDVGKRPCFMSTQLPESEDRSIRRETTSATICILALTPPWHWATESTYAGMHAGLVALFVGGTASGSAEKRERLKSSALLRLSELLMNHLNCARSQYLTKMAAREHQSHR